MSAYITCYHNALSLYRGAIRHGDFGMAGIYAGRVAHWRAMILAAEKDA